MNRRVKAVAFGICISLASGALLAATGSETMAPDASVPSMPLDKRPVVAPPSIRFGAYDPHGHFTDDTSSGIEHLFLPWEDVDLGTLALADEYALTRGRELQIGRASCRERVWIPV